MLGIANSPCTGGAVATFSRARSSTSFQAVVSSIVWNPAWATAQLSRKRTGAGVRNQLRSTSCCSIKSWIWRFRSRPTGAPSSAKPATHVFRIRGRGRSFRRRPRSPWLPSRRSCCALAAELRRGARRVFRLFSAGLIAVALDFRYRPDEAGVLSRAGRRDGHRDARREVGGARGGPPGRQRCE